MISFKHDKLFFEFTIWPTADPKLAALIHWTSERTPSLIVTSAYRDSTEQRQVNPAMLGRSTHETRPFRGADIRRWNILHPQQLVNEINDHWEYDYQRPRLKCAVLEKDHIHLQVHPNTNRKRPD